MAAESTHSFPDVCCPPAERQALYEGEEFGRGRRRFILFICSGVGFWVENQASLLPSSSSLPSPPSTWLQELPAPHIPLLRHSILFKQTLGAGHCPQRFASQKTSILPWFWKRPPSSMTLGGDVPSIKRGRIGCPSCQTQGDRPLPPGGCRAGQDG